MGGDVNHAERKHALLSASGASRWMHCTPSPRLEETFEEPESSVFAAEGTLAHEFGDIGLQLATKLITKRKHTFAAKKLKADALYNSEMDTEVQKYIDEVMERLAIARKTTPGAKLLIEEKFDLTEYIEDGFGTGDANILADDTLEIIDLKYGKGLKVYAEDNPQLKLYGLGALRKYDMAYDIHWVKITIIQPRLDHVSSWKISVEDLTKWAEDEVKPKAKLAYAGEGKQCVGSWCQWCKAKATCQALHDEAMKHAKDDFAEPKLLSEESLLEVYSKMDMYLSWANAVKKYVFEEALKGKNWEGFKLVEGRSVRKYADEEKIKTILRQELYADSDFLNTKLKGIGALEKLVGKKEFPSMFGECVIKPAGAPTLVPEADKRQAISLNSAKDDFKD